MDIGKSHGSESRKVVIEQPTFFPWCGYMGLISLADIFVIYDDVQFERRSWQSRNRIISCNSEWMYINAPTMKAAREAKIKDIRLKEEPDWKKELIRKIEYEYGKTQYYRQYVDEITAVLMKDYKYLLDLNMSIIRLLIRILGISEPEFLYASRLEGVSGAKTDRLISIMEALDQHVYITATGAKGYICPEKFKEKNMELIWYEFIPEEYKQNHSPFVPYMSVIDALFNMGKDRTREYIERIADHSIFGSEDEIR